MNISEDIKKIADHFGYEEQREQLVEEMSELIQALNKYRRSTKGSIVLTDKGKIALDNVVEEISDVEIMLEQIKYLLQIPQEDIVAMKVFKVNRTLENIKKGKY